MARAARLFSDRPFLLATDEPGLTFAEIHDHTERIAAGLADVVGPGEPVGLLVPATNQAVVALVALAKAGAVPVMLPNIYRGEPLATVVGGMLRGTKVVAPRGWHSWLPDHEGVDLGNLPVGAGEPPWRVRPPAPGDPGLVLPTSGTTGAPKGVLVPHGHGVHYAECSVAMRRLGPDDSVHAFSPLFHVDGLFANVVGPLLVGARVALSRGPAISRFWEGCRARGYTTFSYAGGLVARLAGQPPRPDDADNPVRVAYGAPSPPDRARSFERRFGLHLAEGYGSTEAGIPLMAPWDDSRVEEGSCGRAVCGYDVRLAEDGELLVRPHDPSFVMLGYVDDDRATRVRFPGDGWLHTGDLLADIGDGHFAFRGRKDDAIRRQGEFVAPVIVEQAAATYPGVVEAAAYGIADGGEAGEHQVALAVVWAEGAPVDPVGLRGHLWTRLPPVAVPAVVHSVEAFPRSPGTGKVQKHLLPGLGRREPAR